MTPRTAPTPAAYKDAIFLSPHKFIGGPGHAGRARGPTRRCSPTGSPTCPAAARSTYVNPDRAPLPRRRRAPRGGRHPRRSSSRSAPGWSSSSRRPSGVATIEEHGVATVRARDRRLAGGAGDRDPRQPRRATGSRSCPSWSGTERRLPAPQLRGGAAQRPLRHPGARRLLVRRALRPPAARHRPRAQPRVRAPDRDAAARASSPAGCGSTSTTSSTTRSSTTSSRRCTWSPARAGGCSATTGSSRPPGCGATTRDRSSRRCACATCPTPRTGR